MSSEPGTIPVEVKAPQAKGGPGFLAGLLTLQEDSGAEAPAKKRGRPPKPKGMKLAPDELANLLLVPGLLMAAKKWMPEAIWPSGEEALGFCAPLARIIARHLPAVPMSEDAVDLGRMILAGMSYWFRVQPILAAMQEKKKEGEGAHAESTDSRIAEGAEGGDGRGPANGILTGTPGRSGLAVGGSLPVPSGSG